MSESVTKSVSFFFIIALAIGTVFGVIGWVLPAGNLEGWNDINFEAFSLGKGAAAPDQISVLDSGNLQCLAFDGGVTMEQLYGGGEILHGYKEGTDIYPHIHWMPTVSDERSTITWFLEYSWVNRKGVFSAPTTINVTQEVPSLAWNHTRADFPAISGEGYTIGSHIIFRLYRDPNVAVDTYENDAAMLSFGIHYNVDGVGSETLSSK